MKSQTNILWVVLLLLPMAAGTWKNWFDKYDDETRSKAANLIQKLEELLDPSQQTSGERTAGLWVDNLDPQLRERSNHMATVSFNYYNNLTSYNAQLLANASTEQIAWVTPVIAQARLFVKQVGDFRNRTLGWMLLKIINGACISNDPAVNNELVKIGSQLSSIYGKARVTKDKETYALEPNLIDIMAKSRDYDELLWAWRSWRDVTGPLMREKFAEKTKLMNIAARDSGLSDAGQCWRIGNYDEDAIEPMVDKLYKSIRPLYQQLHAYVRRKLIKAYPNQGIDPRGPIPAHILGNMWGQQWDSILDLVVPFPGAPSYDVTDKMIEKQFTPAGMFKEAEKFFTSIGLEDMTETFWANTVMTRPTDRDILCHASATDFYTQDDFRIKMCAVVNMKYLQTIHHEMGHIEYFMQYRGQPTMFRTGANAAFHEAVGDTIALSFMTPKHLQAIGLLDESEQSTDQKAMGSTTEGEINFLLKAALEKVAFLPFGYMIDKYRWDIFTGRITERDYNHKWWLFREKYQGVQAPIPRSEKDFDAGAKYHVAASVPYIRYFLSFIGQFQFQEALCKASGHKGSLYTCDIYQSTEAGDLLKSALSLGASAPWRDVMQQFTGQREFSSHAILAYFKPLQDWLEKQNKDEHIGW